jgi:hypothetical protein
MNGQSPAQFPAVEKVRILMQEYGALRTEVIHRTNNGFQLMTVAGAMVVFLLSRAGEAIAEGIPLWRDWPFAMCIVLALIGLGMGYRFIVRTIERATARINEIQRIVNELSGQSDLLPTAGRKEMV